MKKGTLKAVENYINAFGEDALKKILVQEVNETNDKVLTIIANEGIHHIPEKYILGKKFVASSDKLNFDSEAKLKSQIKNILKRTSRVLKQEKWNKIYLIPTGHPVLYMQIKLLIFRITRLESTDIIYSSDGRYYEIELDQREIINQV